MNLVAVKNAVTSRAGRQILLGKKHSPTIMFVGGIVGVVGATALACRATLRLEDVLDEAQEAHDFARTQSRKDRNRDHAYINAKAAIQITKLYAPAAGLGFVSIAALTGSHVVLTRRNIAVMGAYSALKEGFDEYTKRVIDDVGEEKHLQYRYGYEDREIVEETEKGPQVKKVRTFGRENRSPYARIFDQTCPSWEPSSELNRYFLQCQQDYANRKLHARGHVFLNEIYDALGMERSEAGAVVGWLLTKDGTGDNYVDFGMYDDNESARAFINGRENSILLDFNVNGIIYDQIEMKLPKVLGRRLSDK